MRAVNLIPVEDRRGAGAPGRSGGAVYGVLGALGVLVLLFAVLISTGSAKREKEAQLATVTQQAQAAETQAGTLQAYTQFASLRTTRQQTVASLASSRFDWSHAMHELARTLPATASLSSLRATVSPSVSVPGTADPLRQSINVPAVELAGCARSQGGVAELIAAMRRMDGVQRVSLSSSERNPKAKSVGTAASGGGSAGAGDCRGASFKRAQFSMTVFYAAPTPTAAPGAGATGAPATTAATAASAAAATTTPAPAGGTK